MTSPDRRRSRPRRPTAGALAAPPALTLALMLAVGVPFAAIAQDKPAEKKADKPAEKKADGVFDEEEAPKPAEKKADAPKPKKATDAPKVVGAALERDSIGFTQENAAAQMTELEERMFRLSEALRSLEPENASRLGLALKFSREELVLNQMKQTSGLLKEAQLAKAEIEVRVLLAKLNHLRDLLLAENLDFQMKMARLRQIRSTLNQLDRIIKEEKRELTWSNEADARQAELAKLQEKKPALEALVQAQDDLVRDSKLAKGKDDEAARKAGRESARDRETAIKATAASLAAEPLFAAQDPSHLKAADTPLGDAVSLLGNPEFDPAILAEEKALDAFKKALDGLNERASQDQTAIADAEFRKFERDQLKNRNATNVLAEVSARLGDAGVALQKELIHASEPMQTAEGDLAKIAARPAANDQQEALNRLAKGRAGLAKSLDALLTEIRSELQSRIITELMEMYEAQVVIREVTEIQAPKIAQKSRSAFVLVAGQGPKEAELAEQTEALMVLVEETEFGVALPTALRVIGRQMKAVEGWLKQGDASPKTVTQEKRIEQDLLALAEAMRRLPPTTPPSPGSPLPKDLKDRERELNRLIAELKMIRLLQVRLDDDTIVVDKSRPGDPVLPATLRREIEVLKDGQEEIRDSLKKIAKSLEPPDPKTDFGPLPGLDP